MRPLILDNGPHRCDCLAAIGRRAVRQAETATEHGTFAHLLAETRPDAIFLDIQLGDTDGVETLRWLAARSYPDAVVLISGFNDRVLEAARGIGAGFGVNVPCTLEEPLRAETVRGVLTGLNRAPAPATAAQAVLALLQIPFSYLKTDKAFVTDVSASRDALCIVRAIAGMARGMSLRSLAEGAETETEARTLRELGIDAFQGAFYSMPLALEAVIGWARARTGMWPARQTRNATSPV